MTSETYTVEVTGEQARILASWLSLVVQDTQRCDDQVSPELVEVAEVGQQFATIAEDAGEWPD